MSDFTYSLPFSNDKLLKGIIYTLKDKDKYDVANLLKGASIEIAQGGYSYYDGHWGRNNAVAAYVTFHVNPDYKKLLDTPDIKTLLMTICDELIPADVGYDIKSVSISIDLTKDYDLEDDLILDLERNVNSVSYRIVHEILPEDIKIKGYQMAEVYTYLYAVENSLRLFIEKVCKNKHGEGYFQQIAVPRALQDTIRKRKENAESNKWLSVRGNELFYLDFKDLGNLIDNNWDFFKDYFPNRDFIIPKLNEMAECRNLIAHNSYISDTERNLMKTYYNVILKQITSA
ncbi:MAG: Swt1 family HEPN domain-containing protein [Paludibacter sp.]|nr:Swt1 family HEPN domain-containing protein [Oscillibacter sp.]MDD3323489.1 Swt1 family HEPN domain-containing protein [Paludibacter sp.]MEA4992807.1 Swt1 family HEPN domain-containing protein [Oscillibacter sp.]